MSQGTEAEPGERSHSQRAVIAALLANLAIAVGKFVGFAFTGSSSMLAEGVHSLADTGNQCLLLLGGAPSPQAGRRRAPFGYGRERYFWSFVVALVLFSLGSLFALYEAVDKIRHPETLDNAGLGVRHPRLRDRDGGLVVPHRGQGERGGEGRRHLPPVHPPHQDPRTAGRAARGLRRAVRPCLRARRGDAPP